MPKEIILDYEKTVTIDGVDKILKEGDILDVYELSHAGEIQTSHATTQLTVKRIAKAGRGGVVMFSLIGTRRVYYLEELQRRICQGHIPTRVRIISTPRSSGTSFYEMYQERQRSREALRCANIDQVVTFDDMVSDDYDSEF